MYDAILSLFPSDYVVQNPATVESAVCVCGVLVVAVIGKVILKLFNV